MPPDMPAEMPAKPMQNPVHSRQEGRTRAEDPVNPAALSPAELARALGLPEATICRHLAEGAPQHANGSLNLVHYAAWLNQEPPAPSPGDDAPTNV